MGHVFLFCFFVGVQEKRKIYFTKKKRKKKKKKGGNWDLISFPHHRFYRCVHTHFHVKLSTL